MPNFTLGLYERFHPEMSVLKCLCCSCCWLLLAAAGCCWLRRPIIKYVRMSSKHCIAHIAYLAKAQDRCSRAMSERQRGRRQEFSSSERQRGSRTKFSSLVAQSTFARSCRPSAPLLFRCFAMLFDVIESFFVCYPHLNFSRKKVIDVGLQLAFLPPPTPTSSLLVDSPLDPPRVCSATAIMCHA
jgi:hypothetical protein